MTSKARYYSHCSFCTRHNIAYFRICCKTWSNVYSVYIPTEGLLIDQLLAFPSVVLTVPKIEANTLDFEALKRGSAVLWKRFAALAGLYFWRTEEEASIEMAPVGSYSEGIISSLHPEK